MINVEAKLGNFLPDFRNKKKCLYKTTVAILKKILHQHEINLFIDTYKHLEGCEFLDAVMDHFDFKYILSNLDRDNIPTQGCVIIVANHLLG